MKRILTAILLTLAIAIFFTGCSSLVGDLEVDMSQIENDAEQEALTNENGETRVNMNEKKETVPNYFEQNMTEKFKGLGGRPAFQMKDGHSKITADIETFFVAGLRADKTFVYGYTTRIDSGQGGSGSEEEGGSGGEESGSAGESGSGAGEESKSAGESGAGEESKSAGEGTGGEESKSTGESTSPSVTEIDIFGKNEGNSDAPLVHCGAFYNYDTGKFQVFHENVFERGEEETQEDTESFFMQFDETGGQVFVYDNGHGYVYDSQGTLKFHGNIEDFVREQFKDVYSVLVVNAVTDWQNRIYLEVSIEREKIDVPQPADLNIPLAAESIAQKDQEPSEEDEEEEEKEIEEMEGKMESRILVYEYRVVNSGLDQENTAFEAQKNAWVAMTEGKEYTSPPGGVADWNQVLEKIPDVWGYAFLGGLESKPSVYQWKEVTAFANVDGITTLLPVAKTYVRFKDVKEYWEVEDLFIMENDHYASLRGTTQKFRYYNNQRIERNYTHVWETPETDEKGNPIGTVKHSKVYTQAIYNIFPSRYAQLTNGHTESYWTMDKEKATALGRCIGNEILCWGEDGKVRWIQPGGRFKGTPYEVNEEREAGAFLENGVVYYVDYGRDSMTVGKDRAHGGEEKDAGEIRYENLAGSYASGDTVYDKMFEQEVDKSLEEGESIYGNEFFTEEQVLHAQLSLNRELAGVLKAKDHQGVCQMAEDGKEKGFLLTSQGKGLIFYSVQEGDSVVLEEGTWYRTWNMGDKYVSIGFPKGDSSYGNHDLAFARVYEYSLSELCNESMKQTLESLNAEEESKRQEESEKALESSEASGEDLTEPEESIQNPMDTWDQEYKQKYERTLEESGSVGEEEGSGEDR